MSQKTAPQTLDADGQKRMTRQIDTAFEAVAKLSGTNLPPTEFYETFLTRVLGGIDGYAGAVWIRTPQGYLQIQCQNNMAKVGLDEKPNGRQVHNELLRQAFALARPITLEPYQGIQGEDGSQAANLTDFLVILSPIASEDGTVIGLLEVWSNTYADPRAHATFHKYVEQMAGYASNYNRNHSAKKNSQQEEIWQNLEGFTKKIHTSLNPSEVAFQIANEGRKLLGCDRLSVGIRHNNRKTVIEAVSGADVVEKSSTHVSTMRRLFDRVIDWNETLVYRGQRDESLPPPVLRALDAYLAESNSKLLVLKPVRDDRERPKDKEKEKPCKSALLMECFEPPERSEALIQRLDVTAPHTASALYNAAEMKAVPLKPLWKPVAMVQKGIGGKAKFYGLVGTALVAAIAAALIFIPYPVKIHANGSLLPQERRFIFPQQDGYVRSIMARPGDIVRAKSTVADMFSPDLRKELTDLQSKLVTSEAQIGLYTNQLNDEKLKPDERIQIELRRQDAITERDVSKQQMEAKIRNNYADPTRLGMFRVVAPDFPRARNAAGVANWKVISEDNQDRMLNRLLKPTEPLLRFANTSGAWEIELKIPQKDIGQILKAYKGNDPNEYLLVDVMLSSQTTKQYQGRLYRNKLSPEARENRDDHNESEPVIYATVTVNGDDVPQADRIPDDAMLTGLEVRTKIRCRTHNLGYSLFYGVWEFFYEHVVFFF